MDRRLQFVLLLAIIVFAFALRLYRLDAQELWGDEAASLGARHLSVTQVLLGKTDVHPPLYFFVLREAMLLFGKSLFSIRFVSVFWSVLIVPLVYRIGKRAMRSDVAGVFAALVTVVSTLQVLYAQEARMYAMATAWAAASLWCTVELLRPAPFSLRGRRVGDEGRGWWIAFVLTALIGMYTHYFVAFVVMAEEMALLWAARRSRQMFIRLAVATAVITLIYAPWIPIQRQYAATQAYARWELLTPAVFVDVLRQTLISWSVAVFNVKPAQMFPGADWGTLLVAAFALIGGFAALRARHIEATLIPLCAVAVIALGWAINPILPVFQDRYLMIGTPAYMVLVAAGLQQISSLKSQTPALRAGASVSNLKSSPSTRHSPLSTMILAAGAVAVLVPQAVALRAWFTDPLFAKGEYGKAMAFVSARAQPGDVLLLNNFIQWGLFDYYRPANIPAELVPTEALLSDQKTDAALGKLVAGKTRAWLVDFGYAAQYDPEHRAEHWLAQHGYKQLAQDFIGVRANLYILSAMSAEAKPAHLLDAKLGPSIALVGYTLENDSARPGDSVRLNLFWQATGNMSARYTVFAHMVDSAGQPLAQVDSQPLGGTAPTDSWQVGTTIIDRYAIPIKPDMPPDQYELRVGMYTWPDLTRLPVTLNGQPAGDYVPLATIHVIP